MSGLDLDLYRHIEREIIEELDKQVSQLAAGMSASWEDYRWRVGYIKGLKDALTIAGQAQEDVLGLGRKNPE